MSYYKIAHPAKVHLIRYWPTLFLVLYLSANTIQPLSAATPDKIFPLQRIALDAGTIDYRDSGGSGETVVFLNRGSSLLWSQQVSDFKGSGFRLIAIEFNQPRDMISYGIATINQLTQHLKIDRFHLVGSGAGSVAAMQYALNQQQNLHTLIVGNSLMGLKDPVINALEKRLRSPEFDALPRAVRELGPSFRAMNPQGVQRWLELNAAKEQSATDASRPTIPATEYTPATWQRLKDLKVPTLVFTGDADLYTPPPIMNAFVARLEGAEGLVVPESGHASYWENPEFFNQQVIDFIKRH